MAKNQIRMDTRKSMLKGLLYVFLILRKNRYAPYPSKGIDTPKTQQHGARHEEHDIFNVH